MFYLRQNQPLRVVALTVGRRLTWHLRVEVLLPHLKHQDIIVETRIVPRGRWQARKFFDSLKGYDLAWLHRHLLWPSEMRRLGRTVKGIVLDIDDPVGYSSSNPYNFSLPRCLKFRATARRSGAVFAASDGLVELARPHNDRVSFVPLCADPDAHSMKPRPRGQNEPLRLLWLGGKSTFKYLEQARPHLEAIGKNCPAVELTVVGHEHLELQNIDVHNVPWSPAAERKFLLRSHLGLAPLANDRWTRAKAALKPLQYLANGMPFLGSSVGVNLRLADNGRIGLLADTPEAWVDAVQLLQADEPLRYRMGKEGIAYIRRHHSADVLADQVASVFWSLVGREHPTRAIQEQPMEESAPLWVAAKRD